ncbi:hypothetical protein ANO14919_117470 [Xylariales sp. No.14919]|nr:hypothetical protein ANO14919_117470 [Xylariales sp. No.14919]
MAPHYASAQDPPTPIAYLPDTDPPPLPDTESSSLPDTESPSLPDTVSPWLPFSFATGLVPSSIPNASAQHGDINWSGLDIGSIPAQDIAIRMLVLPMLEGIMLTPHGGAAFGDYWVRVNMADTEGVVQRVELLAIAPRPESIGYCVNYGNTFFIMFFDPADDRIIIQNGSPYPLIFQELDGDTVREVNCNRSIVADPGVWIIGTGEDGSLLEFQVLEKASYNVTSLTHTKRSAGNDTTTSKTRRLANGSTTRTEVSQLASSSNPLLNLGQGEAIKIGAGESGYQLSCVAPIADQRRSAVWRAEHSGMAGKAVVVKVVKPLSAQKDATVEAAEAWLREVSIHSTVGNHYAVVPYLGSDARFHSIYTDYIDAKPLQFHVDPEGKFNGNIVRAWRILGDMAAALCFLHKHDIAHGDVKLGNILFHPLRGAFLHDFNNSFKEGEPRDGGGAPWYLPHEYLSDNTLRGRASDMWALGVVMMWVLGHIPLPDRQPGWNISDIHPSGATSDINLDAQVAMGNWIKFVIASKAGLYEQGGEIEPIIDSLVQSKKRDRVDSATLLEQVSKCNLNH